MTGTVRLRIGEPGTPLARPQEDALAVPHRYDENAASGVIWPARRGERGRSGH